MSTKFVVDTYHEANEDHWSETNYSGDNPRLALEVWADTEPKNRTCVSINVKTQADACELIDYAYKNMAWLKELCEKNKVSYKWEYLDEAIGIAYQTGCESFHECPYGDDDYYRDMVHPFDIG